MKTSSSFLCGRSWVYAFRSVLAFALAGRSSPDRKGNYFLIDA